jgi:tetratricopeptide (TPR) repeat protein
MRREIARSSAQFKKKRMRHPPQPNRSRLRPGIAAVVLLLAVAAWAIVFVGQLHAAPIRRHIDAGMEYARQGKGIAAQREWQAAVRLAPDNAEGWELLSELYLSTSNWEAAIGTLRRLERLKPNTPQLYTHLALCTFLVGDEPSTSRAAEEALRRDPNDEAALLTVASLLGESGTDQQRHLDYLRRLVKIRPNDHDYLLLLAEELSAGRLYDELRLVLEHILAVDPDSTEAYSLRGVCWMNTNPSPEGLVRAEADFRRALQLNPHDAFSHYNLGKTYQLMGQPRKAIAEMEAARNLTPDRSGIYFDLALAYSRVGQPEKAAQARARFETLRQETARISSLEKRCGVNPQDFDLHLELGLIYLSSGDYRRANIYLNQALALRPNDTRAQAALRRLADNSPDPSAAAQKRVADVMRGDASRMARP